MIKNLKLFTYGVLLLNRYKRTNHFRKNYFKVLKKNLFSLFFSRTPQIENIKFYAPKRLRGVDLAMGTFYEDSYYFRASSQSPTIVDIGGNLGIASLYFSFLYPQASIYAYEANPRLKPFLEKNFSQIQNGKFFLFGLGSKDEKSTINLKNDPYGGGSSIKLDGEGIQQSIEIKKASIELKKYEKIDFLKIDVEGFETEIFSDLDKNKILSRVQAGVFEYHQNLAGKNLGWFFTILEKNGFTYHLRLRDIIYFEKK